MKIRRFYPKQVLLGLSGKRLSDLGAAHRTALIIGTRRARKSNIELTIIDDVIAVRHASKANG